MSVSFSAFRLASRNGRADFLTRLVPVCTSAHLHTKTHDVLGRWTATGQGLDSTSPFRMSGKTTSPRAPDALDNRSGHVGGNLRLDLTC